MMMPGGNFGGNNGGNRVPPEEMGEGRFPMGGMGRDMKVCLIINGGYLELCGNDDCVDTNGNMTINGGTIKAANPTGSFTGNFGVLDADGKITISENAEVLLASSNGNERSLNLTPSAGGGMGFGRWQGMQK